MLFVNFLIWLLLSVMVGFYANNKGRSGIIFFLISLFLTPVLGIIIAVLFSSNVEKVEDNYINTGKGKKCPKCAEVVRSEAEVCRYCGGVFVSMQHIDNENLK